MVLRFKFLIKNIVESNRMKTYHLNVLVADFLTLFCFDDCSYYLLCNYVGFKDSNFSNKILSSISILFDDCSYCFCMVCN